MCDLLFVLNAVLAGRLLVSFAFIEIIYLRELWCGKLQNYAKRLHLNENNFNYSMAICSKTMSRCHLTKTKVTRFASFAKAQVSRAYVKLGIHHANIQLYVYSFTSDDQTILINIESNQFEIIICTKSVWFVSTEAYFLTQLMDTDGDDDEHTSSVVEYYIHTFSFIETLCPENYNSWHKYIIITLKARAHCMFYLLDVVIHK